MKPIQPETKGFYIGDVLIVPAEAAISETERVRRFLDARTPISKPVKVITLYDNKTIINEFTHDEFFNMIEG